MNVRLTALKYDEVTWTTSSIRRYITRISSQVSLPSPSLSLSPHGERLNLFNPNPQNHGDQKQSNNNTLIF